MFSRVLLVWPPPQLKTIAAALVCLAMAGCTTMPTVDRARIVDVPLASAHSNIAFTVTTGYRHRPACGEETSCPSQSDEVAAMRFARQVQRVADALQNGARSLYPDLARRAPGLVDRRFDVYVIEGDELGSASSANGRIALNEAFGALRPYDELLAFVITSIMAVGAVFGAVNTMYASVGARTPEIAVLLTLGFKPRSVLTSFLAESAVIALAGGVIGCLMALPINGIVTSTTNWNSFTEVAFAFRVTPGLLLSGLVFAVVMGVLGGFFPARRAAKLPVVQALR